MNNYAGYISKQQIYLAAGLLSIFCLISGWSNVPSNDVAASKVTTVSSLKRDIPDVLNFDVDLSSLSKWDLEIEYSTLNSKSSGQNGAQSLVEVFDGPPPIFAVIETNNILSAYVKGEAGFEILKKEDNFKNLKLKKISMTSLIFETEAGELITVALFDYANL